MGDCQVVVQLGFRVHEVRGSWNEIWTLANTLSTACTYHRNRSPESAVTGGSISAGGLVVSMGRPDDLGGNRTGVAVA